MRRLAMLIACLLAVLAPIASGYDSGGASAASAQQGPGDRCGKGGGAEGAGDAGCSELPTDQVDAPNNPGIVENPDPPDEGVPAWLPWVAASSVAGAMAFWLRRSGR